MYATYEGALKISLNHVREDAVTNRPSIFRYFF